MKRAAYLGHDAAPLFEFLSSLPQILALVFEALKPGGLHFASYKGGGAEGRDRYGRYFNYLSQEDVTEAYRRSVHGIHVVEEPAGFERAAFIDKLLMTAQWRERPSSRRMLGINSLRSQSFGTTPRHDSATATNERSPSGRPVR